jgi:hypothetical protein
MTARSPSELRAALLFAPAPPERMRYGAGYEAGRAAERRATMACIALSAVAIIAAIAEHFAR